MKPTMQDETIQHTDQNKIDELKMTKAATTLQAVTRGFFARRRYRIDSMNDSQLERYSTFIVGNDPCMPATLANYAEPNEKIAIIGTSGLRSVSIACELGQNPAVTPKIFIVDNSYDVHQFWFAFREFINDGNFTSTHEDFTNNLPEFLKKMHRHCSQPSNEVLDALFDGTVSYPDQNAENFIQSIIEKHGYERFRAIVKHTSLIKQSWEDAQTFTKLKNIMNTLGINTVYAYPSNILAVTPDETLQNNMLHNIQHLSPKISIHVVNEFVTYRKTMVHAPKEVKLLENNEVNDAKLTLKLG